MLVEASWRLGDRLLVLTAPNLRGDDVAELQTRLGRLGFDCGRVDGIFGPETTAALAQFQRNCGLNDDGICGGDTIAALELLTRQTGSGPGVAMVREIAQLTDSDRSLSDLRVVVGQFGGMSSIVRQITHALRQRGATVAPTDEPDPSTQASVANRFDAAVYLGFEARPEARNSICYYAVPTFTSPGGQAMAEHLGSRLGRLDPQPEVVGVRHPVLRETKMPAVLCALGPVNRIVDQAPQITAAVTEALAVWVRQPLPEDLEGKTST
jgi:N-acetylmuramoyl-L-alanine amidase